VPNPSWTRRTRVYERLVSAKPEDANSSLNLADCYEELGDYQRAIATYQSSSKIEEARAFSLYALSRLFLMTKNRAKAIQALNQAIDNGFDDGRTVIRDPLFAPLNHDPEYLSSLRRMLGPGFTGFDRVDPTKADMRRGIRLLVSEIRERSPNPYRRFSPAEWDARMQAALRRVDSLDTAGYFVELVSLAGMTGDVHTAVFTGVNSKVLRWVYPLRFWKFADGLYIQVATTELSHLVGAKVIAVQGVPVDSAWQQLMNRLPTENDWMSTYMAQYYLEFPAFLHAIGLAENDRQGRLTLKFADGREEQTEITATDSGGWSSAINSSLGIINPKGYVEGHSAQNPPLWLKHRDQNYWSEYLPANRTLFLQVNTPRNDPAHPWEAFLDDAFASIRENKAERLIIDLRHNGGGYSYMVQSLVHHIIATPFINQPGHLYVFISRITQSAGVYFAVKLEQETYSIFVGEPLGSHPNFFNAPMGRHVTQALPSIDVYFRVADRWTQVSDHQDDRSFLAPDIPVAMTYADYASGKDPALDAALQLDFSEANRYFQDEGGRPIPLYFRWRRPSQRSAFTPDQWIRLKR